MSLSRYTVRASIAVADIARAAVFYEGKLGLAAGAEQSDESRIYACGGGTSLHVYESRAQAGRANTTLATWYVADLEDVVDGLASNGLTFERYDDPALKADERGIHELPDGRVAWFRDPDGNTFAIEEGSVS
jgi:catechol 2,3-dioxygenase-like lactoylglutathione lyase family enzyme